MNIILFIGFLLLFIDFIIENEREEKARNQKKESKKNKKF